MNPVEAIHGKLVYGRRVRVLVERLAPLLPQGASVLDVGCGDGLITSLVAQARPDIAASGIDVLVRGETRIPVEPFDGTRIPRPDNSVDAVMFVDVLHHTPDPEVLLREAARVARTCVILKDHTLDGFLAGPTLRFMDHVGNARHGVVLPYNYWPESRWRAAFERVGLKPRHWQPRLGLYPWPASWIFDRGLHFIARLEKD